MDNPEHPTTYALITEDEIIRGVIPPQDRVEIDNHIIHFDPDGFCSFDKGDPASTFRYHTTANAQPLSLGRLSLYPVNISGELPESLQPSLASWSARNPRGSVSHVEKTPIKDRSGRSLGFRLTSRRITL